MFSLIKVSIIILFDILQKIKTQSLCEYNDCFNCSVCGTEDTCDCEWSINNDKCQKSIMKSTFDYSYDYFNKCYDDLSLKIQNIYCGNSFLKIDDNTSTNVKLIENDGFYGAQNLYCEYSYSLLSSQSNIYYNIIAKVSLSLLDYMNLYIVVTHFDNTIENSKITEEKFEKKYKNIKRIKIQFYCTQQLTLNPFSIEISKATENKSYKLLISVGIIFLCCVLCGLIIFFVSRKAARNARRRQELFLQMARNNQRYGDGGNFNRVSQSSNRDPSSSSESEISIQEINTKKIEKLLKTTLAPMKYNIYLGVKDGNPCNVCTICIEEFKVDKSKVSITPCQHVFHFQCLSDWLMKNLINPKCPNCNYNLIQEKNVISSQGFYDIPELECNVMKSSEYRLNNLERRISYNEHNINNMVASGLDTGENRLMERNESYRYKDRNNVITSVSISNENLNKKENENENNDKKEQNIPTNAENKEEDEDIVVI